MGRRSSKRPEEFDEMDDFPSDEDAGSELFTRQRLVAGGLTAFAVAFSYVGANAMWYQPHQHMSAFFETRIITKGAVAAEETSDRPTTIVRIEEEPATDEVPTAGIPEADIPALPATAPAPGVEPAIAEEEVAGRDEAVEQVQRVLADLGIYAGGIDGLTGPQTRGAIEAYRAKTGLAGGGEIDDALLRHLGLAPEGEQRMAAAPSNVQSDAVMQAAMPSDPDPDPRIMRIQAGLKAFGNDAIEIDGDVGPETSAALTEFQSLFGLAVTGKPDEATEKKMREIGLTN